MITENAGQIDNESLKSQMPFKPKYASWTSAIMLNFVSHWSVSPGIHSRRWQNLSFPIDIQGTLDKQAPNMSPLNLWMTNGQSESSLFDVQTFCAEKYA